MGKSKLLGIDTIDPFYYTDAHHRRNGAIDRTTAAVVRDGSRPARNSNLVPIRSSTMAWATPFDVHRSVSVGSSNGLCDAVLRARVGRPSLAPGRYFRLLLVGYFEGIDFRDFHVGIA